MEIFETSEGYSVVLGDQLERLLTVTFFWPLERAAPEFENFCAKDRVIGCAGTTELRTV